MADFAPTHPGEILLTEFLEPMGISQYRIAKAIDVPARRINEIVHGKRGITADTALRLSRALGLNDMFFINMQAHYDAEVVREQLATELARSTISREPELLIAVSAAVSGQSRAHEPVRSLSAAIKTSRLMKAMRARLRRGSRRLWPGGAGLVR